MITEYRINAYHVMWLFVFFDLPVTTKTERKAAARFRKELEGDGFTMMQFSVYIRHCPSKENRDVHSKRVKEMIPQKGHIVILAVTDKQYSEMINIWGMKQTPIKQAPQQLELF